MRQCCPKCGAQMLELFTSVVCEHCEPPKIVYGRWYYGYMPHPAHDTSDYIFRTVEALRRAYQEKGEKLRNYAKVQSPYPIDYSDVGDYRELYLALDRAWADKLDELPEDHWRRYLKSYRAISFIIEIHHEV